MLDNRYKSENNYSDHLSKVYIKLARHFSSLEIDGNFSLQCNHLVAEHQANAVHSM
jgi:hypothetical protein